MAKKKKAEGKGQKANEATPQPSQGRHFQVPNCQVDIRSLSRGVPVDELLAIAFSLVTSNPKAKVSFTISVLED